jgi:hypothetical protein
VTYEFKTEDGQLWTIDTERGTWARVSTILAAPSVIAAESNLSNYVPAEGGRLVSIGNGQYYLEGRQPKDGLCRVAVITVLTDEDEGSCVTFLQANVTVKDPNHREIKKYRCVALAAPQDPSQISMSAK